jgi:hypothetical protein
MKIAGINIGLLHELFAGLCSAIRSWATVGILSVFATFVLQSPTHAQSCSAPQLLLETDFPYTLDTCQTGYSPASLCGGGLVPAGPSAVFLLYLAYPPSGLLLTATPSSSDFDPAILVQTEQCGELGNCPFFVDNAGPGGEEMFALNQLDSGKYYIVVTSQNPDAACGVVSVDVQNTLGGSPSNDGIFRAGFDY